MDLNQAELSTQLGFPVRQTLSNIEAGKRKVTAEELMKFMRVLQKDLSYFTDPFLMLEEVAVSWRARDVPKTLDAFEAKMMPVVAAYRELAPDLGFARNVLVPQLPLTLRSSFEDAAAAAGRLVQEWELGKTPSRTLARAAEQRLNLLVLMVDAPVGISGAALHLPEFDTILINRNETAGRRNYDLGHELFHLLTWHGMPPDRVDEEDTTGKKKKRVESLAEAFTSALLMPAESIQAAWQDRKDAEVHGWLKDTARAWGVSGQALLWRLVNLGFLRKVDLLKINQARLVQGADQSRPKRFSRHYVTCLHQGLDRGLISVRRLAGLLHCTLENLGDLFREYALEPPFDL